MRAKEFIKEIDYASDLGKLAISAEQLIAKSSPIGEIDGQDVLVYKSGNQECYFFTDGSAITSLILISQNRLRAIKNFTGKPGAITALIVFYTNELKNRLIIDKTEQFTESGIKWLCSLIKAGGRGLKITDKDGNTPDAEVIYDEWENAMTSDVHGPTTLIIETTTRRKLYKRDELLMIPIQWIGESYEDYGRMAALRASKTTLLEYNRQVTANQVGDRVIFSFIKDPSLGSDLPENLKRFRNRMRTLKNSSPEQINAVIKPEERISLINEILANIESRDPTPNKIYTPWLAKVYSKGDLAIEDINRMDFLRLFDLAKKRKKIKPEHADINRFKTYRAFEDTMIEVYNSFDDLEAEMMPEGKASKAYEDENVLVVVPHDEAAACKYGRNTRWCTASTKGHNMFDQYNRTGKLYILIPKQPKYEGEKYQLHFSSNSYMDENDDPVALTDILNRFPGTKEFFFNTEPELREKIEFVPDEELQQAIESIAELVQERIWEEVSDWESRDDYYYQYLRDEGLVDDDGNVDWDKVEQAGLTYSEYNPEVERWTEDIMNTVTPTPDELRDIIADDPYEYSHYQNIKTLPTLIGIILREKYRGRRDEGDANIGQWLKEKASIKKEGNRWKAYVVPSLSLPR